MENITPPFLMAPKIKDTVSILNLVKVTYLLRLKRSIIILQPPGAFRTIESWIQYPGPWFSAISKATFPHTIHFLKVPEPFHILSIRKGNLMVPAAQVGGCGMGLNTGSKGLPTPRPKPQRSPRIANATLRNLPKKSSYSPICWESKKKLRPQKFPSLLEASRNMEAQNACSLMAWPSQGSDVTAV